MTGGRHFRRTGAGITAALGAVLLFLAPLSVFADQTPSVQLRKGGSFRQIGSGEFLNTPDGKPAWRGKGGDDNGQKSFLEHDLGGRKFPAAQGTVAFELTRDEILHREAVFSLSDNTYQRLFTFRIYWSGADGQPEIYLYAANRTSQIAPFWYVTDPGNFGYPKPRIPVGRAVGKGERVRVVLTWNGNAGQIFVDGRSLGVKTNPSAPFSELAAAASKVILGAETDIRNPGGAWSMMRSAITDFRVYDVSFPDGNVPDAPSTPSLVRQVSDDSFKVPGISGKLVAGDKVNVTLLAAPGGKASIDMGRAKGIPLEEVPPRAAAPGSPAVDNGTYQGSYTIKPGDDFENGQIVGNFVSSDNVVAEPVASASKWTIDTKPRVAFNIDRKDLPADSASKARIKLAAKDANGVPVKGRHLKLTLATTDEYTGTVGAGEFGKEVGATVETRWKGETDAWGEVEFDYRAGFAAKTVILTAKDLDSGGVSVDYITAFKEASIDIMLTAPVNRAAARRGVQYILKVEASRTELTADGRSRSVIRATLLDPNGAPVAGDPVAFTLSSPNGTLRTIEGATNASGVATAEYVAGKKIGIVVVTATATLRNATGNVSIILLSDAPAKIYLKAKPESLPADGFSRADLSVKVTDINDNPNKDTKVVFRVSRGGGKLEYPERVTDRFGDTQNRYTSGTTPGVASVLATVRSKVPTEAELAKARDVLFVPYNPEGDEIRVEKWLKKKGDAALAGEPVLEYTVGRNRDVKVLPAPYDLTLGDIFVEYWDNAEVGQTLGIVVPAVK